MLLSIYQYKSIFVFLSAFLFSFLILSCKDEGTPPIELPEGYQEDIPWPSLADSPWPMFRGDPQGTHRSKYAGPKAGVVDWINEDVQLTCGLCLGYENDVYVSSNYPPGIYRLNGNTGVMDWAYKITGPVVDLTPTPLILKDSTIIATTGNLYELLGLTPQGSLKWKYKAADAIFIRGMTVSKEGLIMFIDETNTLYAVDKNGNLKWKVQDPLFCDYGLVTLTFSPDGKTLYFPGIGVALVAFDMESKSIKWTWGTETIRCFPLVDCKGHIYVLGNEISINNKHSLYSLNPDGTVNWIYEHNNKNITRPGCALSMNKKGDIYFALDTLYCIDYKGKLKFQKPLDPYTPVDILIDNENNLYILEHKDGNTVATKRDEEGKIIWTIKDQIKYWPGYSGCITKNGQWIFPSYQYDPQIVSIK